MTEGSIKLKYIPATSKGIHFYHLFFLAFDNLEQSKGEHMIEIIYLIGFFLNIHTIKTCPETCSLWPWLCDMERKLILPFIDTHSELPIKWRITIELKHNTSLNKEGKNQTVWWPTSILLTVEWQDLQRHHPESLFMVHGHLREKGNDWKLHFFSVLLKNDSCLKVVQGPQEFTHNKGLGLSVFQTTVRSYLLYSILICATPTESETHFNRIEMLWNSLTGANFLLMEE